MKKIIAISLMLLLLTNFVKADQLEWITKSEAERAVEVIKKQKKLILYCACCTGDTQELVKIKSAEIQYTGSEDYYTVLISFVGENGEKQSQTIDLAYVWTNSKSQKQTIGQLLSLDHDPCSDGNF